MTETKTQVYEGLFLFPQVATANLQGATDHIMSILQRAEAKVISFRKWDERRLAYEIKGNKRGVYFLAYFEAPTGNLARLERDCNLSEQMLRALITRADHLPMEQIEAVDGRAELADEIKLRAEQPAASVPSDEADDADDRSDYDSDDDDDTDSAPQRTSRARV